MPNNFKEALYKQKYGSGVSNVTGETHRPSTAQEISRRAADHAKEAKKLRKSSDSPKEAIMHHLRKAAELDKKAAKLRNL